MALTGVANKMTVVPGPLFIDEDILFAMVNLLSCYTWHRKNSVEADAEAAA
jgi:hypothetical protein